MKRGDGDVDILSVAETKQKKAFCRKFPEFPVGNFFYVDIQIGSAY